MRIRKSDQTARIGAFILGLWLLRDTPTAAHASCLPFVQQANGVLPVEAVEAFEQSLAISTGKPLFNVLKSADRYRLMDVTSSGRLLGAFYISANLDAGVLEFSVRTRITIDSVEHTASWRSKDAFAAMMHHFSNNVKKIRAVWKEPGPNLSKFNEGVRNGLPLEDAAKLTWTGQQAMNFGYTEILKTPIGAKGDDGDYQLVIVEFSPRD